MPPKPGNEPAAASEAEGGSETILVVEDDQLVRGYVSAQLDHLAYRTVVAASGPEALAQIDKGLAFKFVPHPKADFGDFNWKVG